MNEEDSKISSKKVITVIYEPNSNINLQEKLEIFEIQNTESNSHNNKLGVGSSNRINENSNNNSNLNTINNNNSIINNNANYIKTSNASNNNLNTVNSNIGNSNILSNIDKRIKIGEIDILGTAVTQQVSLIFENGGGPSTEVDFGYIYFGLSKEINAFLVNNGPKTVEFDINFISNEASLKGYSNDELILTPAEEGKKNNETILSASPKIGQILPYSQIAIMFTCKTKLKKSIKGWKKGISAENNNLNASSTLTPTFNIDKNKNNNDNIRTNNILSSRGDLSSNRQDSPLKSNLVKNGRTKLNGPSPTANKSGVIFDSEEENYLYNTIININEKLTHSNKQSNYFAAMTSKNNNYFRDTLNIKMTADGVKPNIMLDKVEVNFWDCRIKEEKNVILEIKNLNKQLSVDYYFEKTHCFTALPGKDIIPPNGKKKIVLSFKPHSFGDFNTYLPLKYINGLYDIKIKVMGTCKGMDPFKDKNSVKAELNLNFDANNNSNFNKNKVIGIDRINTIKKFNNIIPNILSSNYTKTYDFDKHDILELNDNNNITLLNETNNLSTSCLVTKKKHSINNIKNNTNNSMYSTDIATININNIDNLKPNITRNNIVRYGYGSGYTTCNNISKTAIKLLVSFVKKDNEESYNKLLYYLYNKKQTNQEFRMLTQTIETLLKDKTINRDIIKNYIDKYSKFEEYQKQKHNFNMVLPTQRQERRFEKFLITEFDNIKEENDNESVSDLSFCNDINDNNNSNNKSKPITNKLAKEKSPCNYNSKEIAKRNKLNNMYKKIKNKKKHTYKDFEKIDKIDYLLNENTSDYLISNNLDENNIKFIHTDPKLNNITNKIILNDFKMPNVKLPENTDNLWVINPLGKYKPVSNKINDLTQNTVDELDKISKKPGHIPHSTPFNNVEAEQINTYLTGYDLQKIIISKNEFNFGEMFIGSEASQKFYIKNTLHISIYFKLEAKFMELSESKPNLMIIGPGLTEEVNIICKAKTKNKICGIGFNYSLNNQHTFKIKIEANIIPVKLKITPDSCSHNFNFNNNKEKYEIAKYTGNLNSKSSSKQKYLKRMKSEVKSNQNIGIISTFPIELYNQGNAKAEFKWYEPLYNCFYIEPIKGYVEPGKKEIVNINFNPKKAQNIPNNTRDGLNISEDLKCNLTYGNEIKFNISANLPNAKVSFLNNKDYIDFGNVNIGVKVTEKFILHNQRKIHTLYHIEKYSDNLSFDNDIGYIKDKEHIDISFICFEKNDSYEEEVEIYIRGGAPLILKVKACVNIPDIEIEQEKFDFGRASYKERRTLDLTLFNKSNQTAKIEVDFRNDEYSYFSMNLKKDQLALYENKIKEIKESNNISTINYETPQNNNDLNNKICYNDFNNSREEDLVEDDSFQNANSNLIENYRFFEIEIEKNSKLHFDFIFNSGIGVDPKSINVKTKFKLKGYKEDFPELSKVVTAEIVDVKVEISPHSILFNKTFISGGNLFVNKDKCLGSTKLKIYSTESNKPINWLIDTSDLDKFNGVFTCSHTRGTIYPSNLDQLKKQNKLSKQDKAHPDYIFFYFRPKEKRIYEAKFNVYIIENNHNGKEEKSLVKVVKIEGEGTMPRIYYSEREVILPVVPLNILSKKNFKIINDGYDMLQLSFRIDCQLGTLPIAINFPNGEKLNSNSEIEVELMLKSNKPISFTTKLYIEDPEYNMSSYILISGITDNDIFTNYDYFYHNNLNIDFNNVYSNKSQVFKNNYNQNNVQSMSFVEGNVEYIPPKELEDHKDYYIFEAYKGCLNTYSRNKAISNNSLRDIENIDNKDTKDLKSKNKDNDNKSQNSDNNSLIKSKKRNIINSKLNYIQQFILFVFKDNHEFRCFPLDFAKMENQCELIYEFVKQLSGNHNLTRKVEIIEDDKKPLYIRNQFNELIKYLQEHGASLNNVFAEYLLEKHSFAKLLTIDSYSKSVLCDKIMHKSDNNSYFNPNVHNNDSKESRYMHYYQGYLDKHNQLHNESWLNLIYQIIKIYYLSKININSYKKALSHIYDYTQLNNTDTIDSCKVGNSNVYSKTQLYLLKWIQECHNSKTHNFKKEIKSFKDDNINNGLIILGLLISYLPESSSNNSGGIRTNKKKNTLNYSGINLNDYYTNLSLINNNYAELKSFIDNNFDKITKKLKDFNIPYHVANYEYDYLIKSDPREMALFFSILFQNLSHFIPKTRVFECDLNSECSKDFIITNNSNKVSEYTVYKEGSDDFSIYIPTTSNSVINNNTNNLSNQLSGDAFNANNYILYNFKNIYNGLNDIKINPQEQKTFHIVFKSRFSDPVESKLYLISKSENLLNRAAPIVYKLTSKILKKRSLGNVHFVRSPMFKKLNFDISIKNPFKEKGDFEISLEIIKTSEINYANDNKSTYNSGSKYNSKSNPKKNVFVATKDNIYDVFFLKNDDKRLLRLDPEGTKTLSLCFYPIDLFQYICNITFLDKRTGEFQYTVKGIGEYSELYEKEKLDFECTVDEHKEIVLDIKQNNTHLEKACQSLNMKIPPNLNVAEIDSLLNKRIVGKYNFLVESTRSYFIVDNKASLEVNMNLTPNNYKKLEASSNYNQQLNKNSVFSNKNSSMNIGKQNNLNTNNNNNSNNLIHNTSINNLANIANIANIKKHKNSNIQINKLSDASLNMLNSNSLIEEHNSPSLSQINNYQKLSDNKIYIKFYSKICSSFEGEIVLKNQTIPSDIRIYKIQILVKPKQINSTLEFVCPVHQEILQELPFENKSDKEWYYKIELSDNIGNFFSAPSDKRIQKKSKGIINLVFKPTDIRQIKAYLTITNTSTREKYKYTLIGKVDEPLAKDNIKYNIKVGETKTHNIVLENTSLVPITYNVETDLSDILAFKGYSYKPMLNNNNNLNQSSNNNSSVLDKNGSSIKIDPKTEFNYQIMLKPVLGKRYFGKLVFIQDTKNYVWYTLEIDAERNFKASTENCLKMSCQIRNSIYRDFTLVNKTNKSVVYTTEKKGEFLKGSNFIKVEPKSNAIYRLYFEPLKIGQFEGKLHIFSEVIGEQFFDLLLISTPCPQECLPTIKAELGKSERTFVELKNPTSDYLEVTPIKINKAIIELYPDKIIIPPQSVKQVVIIYTPSSLGTEEVCELILDSKIGKWEYLIKGLGYSPTNMKTTIVNTFVGGLVSGSINFKNPFRKHNKDNNFDIEIFNYDYCNSNNIIEDGNKIENTVNKENNNSNTNSAFSLIRKDKLQSNTVFIEPSSYQQIFFSFNPNKLAKYYAEIVISHSKTLKWVYPLEGITEVKSNNKPIIFKTKSKKVLESKLILELTDTPEIDIKKEKFDYTIKVKEEKYSSLVYKCFSYEPYNEITKCEIKNNSIDNIADSIDTKTNNTTIKKRINKSSYIINNYNEEISKNIVSFSYKQEMNCRFYPLRPFKTECEFIVNKRSGGRWIFDIILEATDSDPDDILYIKSSLNKISEFNFSLNNVFTKVVDFIAYFSHDSSAEFSVTPKEGKLNQSGKNEGTLFIVSYLPVEYGKIKIAKLIIETDEVQWLFEIRGSHLDYKLPDIKNTEVNKPTANSINRSEAISKLNIVNKRIYKEKLSKFNKI